MNFGKVNIVIPIHLIVIVFILNKAQASPRFLIIGGNITRLGAIPFQVSIQVEGGHFCGGSIINNYYVLTAAHCLYDENEAYLKVVVGTVDLRKPYKIHKIDKIIMHEKYNNHTFLHDIALIRVKKPFKFSYKVKPVHLPEPNEYIRKGTPAIVSGWGQRSLSDEDKRTRECDLLHAARVYIMDLNECRKVMSPSRIYSTHICYEGRVKNETYREGACYGDSGGPVAVGNKLIGIVSWGLGCGLLHHPEINTRVSKYLKWIKYQMSSDSKFLALRNDSSYFNKINFLVIIILLYNSIYNSLS